MMKTFSICLLVLLAALAVPTVHAQQPIVVDNLEATFEGAWTNGAAAADKFGSDYRFSYCIGAKEAPATATFRPRIPTGGKYHVEILYPRGANRSTNALWSISGTVGLLAVKVNQQLNGGDWVRIASNIEFASGDKGFVKLANNTGETEKTSVGQPVVVADAVRLIPAASQEEPRTASNTGSAIEVDDTAVELEGNWAPVEGNKDRRGKLQHFAMMKDTSMAIATFRPDFPQAGKYDVEIYYLSGKNRSDAVPWSLTCADGELTGFLDQTQNGGAWVRLASGKNFNAGTYGYLRLHNGPGKAGLLVLADAVRFVPTGAAASAPAQSSPTATAVTPARPGATFALNVKTVGSGTVTRSSQQIRYPANASVTLTAKPEEGYVFGGWTGDINRMLNPLPITMTSDIEVTANFWAAGIGAIVDDANAEFVGSWMHPTQKWGNPKYDDYQYYSTADRETASAIFRPDLPRAGLYDVYIWYTAGGQRSTAAPWEVVCKEGKFPVNVDQTVKGQEWVLLISGKEFEKGTKGYARLSNKAAPNAVVVADAVAFVYVGAP